MQHVVGMDVINNMVFVSFSVFNMGSFENEILFCQSVERCIPETCIHGLDGQDTPSRSDFYGSASFPLMKPSFIIFQLQSSYGLDK